jgi:glucose dehydrogenase
MNIILKLLILIKKKISQSYGLDILSPVGILSDKEHEIIYALFTVLTGREFPYNNYVLKLNEKTLTMPGLLQEFKQGIVLLNEIAKNKFCLKCFLVGSEEEKEKVLKLIHRRYKSKYNYSLWRKRLRLTGENLDLILLPSSKLRFRKFVTRTLLSIFYKSKQGWSIVKYDEYPSAILMEDLEGEIIKVEKKSFDTILYLSDGTTETLHPSNILLKNGIVEYIKTKDQRQISKLTKKAYNDLSEIIINLFDSNTNDKIDIDDDNAVINLLNNEYQERKKKHYSLPSKIKKNYDAIIVGSGPVGAAAAEILVEKGIDVLMIESGSNHSVSNFKMMNNFIDNDKDWEFRPWIHESTQDDMGVNTWVIRKEGGGSNAWGGTTPRFMQSDFRLKSTHGVGVDWPISYQDLEPFYVKAEEFLGVSGEFDGSYDSPRSNNYPMPATALQNYDLIAKKAAGKINVPFHSVPGARNSIQYKDRSACVGYSVCRSCPVAAKYCSTYTINKLKRYDNFKIIYNSHVKEVLIDKNKNIKGVLCIDQNNLEYTFRSKKVILAAHTINNPAILLRSAKNYFPEGLANSSGQLGRNLMDHVKYYMMGKIDEKVYSHKLGFETSASSHFHDHTSRNRYGASRILVRETSGPTPNDIAMSSGFWGNKLEEEIKKTFNHSLVLGCLSEQLPYQDNRVELSSTIKNEFGQPAVKVSYKLMRKYEQDAYRNMIKILKSIYHEIPSKEVQIIMPPSNCGHLMGTHRMGNNSKDSVTNSFLESHDIDNLYIAGNGSFPTGSTSNPTLTSVALTIRMAEKIISEMN